jgi:crotonobetainyl-CoA:carnitine CoA-transferase CaiB-like acyl-CoA transferase
MDRSKLPLADVRVVDLTVVWAGPLATQLLGDLGAEVIRVENTHVWQTYTRGLMARPPKTLLQAGIPWAVGYPERDPGDRPWNRHPAAVNMFRNKLGMTVDARNDEGKGIVRRLIERSDVIYENNVPETMDKLGFTYERLREWNERIIYVRVPAFGPTGERKNYRGLGSHIEGAIGHTLLRGYTDADPTSNTVVYAGDELAGLQGAFTVIAALRYRRRTGKGQLVEIAQAESGFGMFAHAYLDWALNRRLHGPIGNRDLFAAAPSGVYPTRGEDRWIAITVADDEQWRRLCALLGAPYGTAEDRRFADAESRVANHDDLDALIAEWTRPHDNRELASRLQAEGIAAGPVMSAADLYEDAHMRERGFFQPVTHPEFGPKTYQFPGFPFRYEDLPLAIDRPPVALGADNEYVYRDILGYTAEEYAGFVERGHIGQDFDATIR